MSGSKTKILALQIESKTLISGCKEKNPAHKCEEGCKLDTYLTVAVDKKV
jgi:hypothetical protein